MIQDIGRPLSAWCLAILLTGCTVFPEPNPPRLMDLPIPDIAAWDGATLGKVLRVDTPQATKPFDGSRILVKPAPMEFQAYGGVRWRDTAPVMVRELLIGALRQDGRFAGVVSETSPTGSELTLVSDLHGIHSEQSGDGQQVVVGLYAQLMDNRSRQTLCVRNFLVRTPADNGNLGTVVAAFGEGGATLVEQVRGWLDECLALTGISGKDPARQP